MPACRQHLRSARRSCSPTTQLISSTHQVGCWGSLLAVRAVAGACTSCLAGASPRFRHSAPSHSCHAVPPPSASQIGQLATCVFAKAATLSHRISALVNVQSVYCGAMLAGTTGHPKAAMLSHRISDVEKLIFLSSHGLLLAGTTGHPKAAMLSHRSSPVTLRSSPLLSSFSQARRGTPRRPC